MTQQELEVKSNFINDLKFPIMNAESMLIGLTEYKDSEIY